MSERAQVQRFTDRRLLKSSTVMAVLGYQDRSAFWQFVHAQGLPCIRLGPRRIMFDERQLTDWLDQRSTSGN